MTYHNCNKPASFLVKLNAVVTALDALENSPNSVTRVYRTGAEANPRYGARWKHGLKIEALNARLAPDGSTLSFWRIGYFFEFKTGFFSRWLLNRAIRKWERDNA